MPGRLGNLTGLPTKVLTDPRERLPTLREVLGAARSAHGRVVVEIKNLPIDDDFDVTPRYADRILDEVDASGLDRSRIVVQSFYPPDVLIAQRRGFTTSVISLPGTNHVFPEATAALGPDWLTPAWPLDPLYTLRARLARLQVMPYTLDRAADVRAAARLRVDGVITNDPAMAARALGQR